MIITDKINISDGVSRNDNIKGRIVITQKSTGKIIGQFDNMVVNGGKKFITHFLLGYLNTDPAIKYKIGYISFGSAGVGGTVQPTDTALTNNAMYYDESTISNWYTYGFTSSTTDGYAVPGDGKIYSKTGSTIKCLGKILTSTEFFNASDTSSYPYIKFTSEVSGEDDFGVKGATSMQIRELGLFLTKSKTVGAAEVTVPFNIVNAVYNTVGQTPFTDGVPGEGMFSKVSFGDKQPLVFNSADSYSIEYYVYF